MHNAPPPLLIVQRVVGSRVRTERLSYRWMPERCRHRRKSTERRRRRTHNALSPVAGVQRAVAIGMRSMHSGEGTQGDARPNAEGRGYARTRIRFWCPNARPNAR